MGNSKIIYNDETLIDLTEDTVSADTLLLGVTAHDASGEKVTGNVSSLKNPYALTFTGAAAGTYDGSKAVEINIPEPSSASAIERGSFQFVATKSTTTEYTHTFENSYKEAPSVYFDLIWTGTGTEAANNLYAVLLEVTETGFTVRVYNNDSSNRTVGINWFAITDESNLSTGGGTVTDEQIQNAVDKYLTENPVESPVESVNGKTGQVELTADDVNAVSSDGLQSAINTALAQAKESGEFDGAAGYTPIKGTDYFTEEDKSEFLTNVTSKIGVISGTNLLHNADWAYSLVNQRSHSGAVTDAYCIDRWIGNGIVTPVGGEYVTLAKDTSMTQRMEILPAALGDKQLAFSIDIEGEIQSVPLIFPSVGSTYSNGISLDGCDIELGFVSSSGASICGVQSTSIPYLKITSSADINVKRPFLELGKVSHILETPQLPYSSNLAACQRYFLMLQNTAIYAGCAQGTNVIMFSIPTPTTMRIMPSPTVSDVKATAYTSTGAFSTKPAIFSVNSFGNNFVRGVCTFTETEFPAYIIYNLQMPVVGVGLSADL